MHHNRIMCVRTHMTYVHTYIQRRLQKYLIVIDSGKFCGVQFSQLQIEIKEVSKKGKEDIKGKLESKLESKKIT